MRIRLEIIAAGSARVIERPGPAVHLGRDPESDVLIEGPASDAVSWRHARIDLTPAGAYLSDLESTNGTRLNERRVTEAVAVESGDYIQLGQSGPVLKVIELDLSRSSPALAPAPPAPAPVPAPEAELVEVLPLQPPDEKPPPEAPPVPPAVPYHGHGRPRPRRRPVKMRGARQYQLILAAAVTGLALVLVVVLVLVLVSRGRRENGSVATLAVNEPDRPAGRAAPVHPRPLDPAGNRPAAGVLEPGPRAPDPGPRVPWRGPRGLGRGPGPLQGRGGAHRPFAPDPMPADAPSADRRPIGRYAPERNGPPSVLLWRANPAAPWARLRAFERVATAGHLVSLPGYRSPVLLDSGVQLGLWGNVPEFSNFPPVLESSVMLNVPAPGTDLDFILDHGRVHLANLKSSGPAQVRVRFQQAIWDLSLANSNAEAVLELWDAYPQAGSESTGRKQSTCLGLFVKGQVQVRAGTAEYRMPDSSRLTWSSDHPDPIGPEVLPQLPDWWTNKIDAKAQRVGETMLALIEFSDLLNKPEPVIDVVLTQVRESPDAPNRVLGTLFLGALEAIPHLLDALEDRQHPEVRSTAAYVLRHWLSISVDNTPELLRTLQERKGFSPEKAEIIVRLLHRLSEQELKDKRTYETLVGYLNHDNLAIRQLAFEHLSLLFPETAGKVPYNPLADPEQRKQAMEQWTKLKGAP